MKNRISLLFVLLFLMACSQPQIRDESSPWFRVPPGSLLELHQDIIVPPRYARIFLQDGEIVTHGDLDRYHPSCNFEVWNLSQERQIIKKDRFTVLRVEQGYEQVVGLANKQVAGFIWIDGPAHISRYLHHWISSENQPGVRRMTCRGAQQDYQDVELPTVDEIRVALGGIASFKY